MYFNTVYLPSTFFFPSSRSCLIQVSFYVHVLLSLLLLIVIIFGLDSAYNWKCDIGFLSLAYIAQHNDLHFHLFSYKWHNFILYGWIILYHVCISHFLYPVITCQTPKVFPKLGYCQ
jgi:hypothetical protein